MSYYEDEYISPITEDIDDFQFVNNDMADSDSESFTTVSSNRKKTRKLFEDAKKIDNGYHKLKMGKTEKLSGIEVYSTNSTPGTMIRDAITGARFESYKVGSKNEHLFFKVGMAAGHTESGNIILFFDSPEQYEKHMKTTVSQSIKETWTNNCAKVKR